MTQYTKDHVESCGPVCIDILGLQTLSIIQRTVDCINASGRDVSLSSIPEDDPKIIALFCSGETDGVFQYESDGMKSLLKSFKPDNFDDLMLLNAMYRPGPLDNIPALMEAKNRKHSAINCGGIVETILAETYGELVYQEQVMRILHEVYGFELGKTDIIRRIFGRKNADTIAEIHAECIQKAETRGLDKTTENTLFNFLISRTIYAFNKSHAAAYTKIAWQCAYLKANYPREYEDARHTDR